MPRRKEPRIPDALLDQLLGWLRTSNRYFLELPGEPVRTGLRAPTKRNHCGQEEREEKKEAREERSMVLTEMMHQAASLGPLLEKRRKAIEARLAAGMALRIGYRNERV